MNLGQRETEGESTRFFFLEALRVASGRPAVWLTTWFSMVVMAFVVTLPWVNWFGGVFDNYEPGTLVWTLTRAFRTDHSAEMGALNAATARAGAVLVFVSYLFGVFAAGGWLQVLLERTHGQSFRRFCLGGARYFWRFFRVLVLTLLVLAFFSWAFYEWPWKWIVLNWMFGVPKSDFSSLETLSSELTVRRLGWAQDGLFALFFGLTLIWGRYARTRLALHGTSSALLAGLASLFLMLRHPIKTLRPMVFLLLIEAGLAIGLGIATTNVELGLQEAPTILRILLLFGLGQLLLLLREILRGADYCVAVLVSQELVEAPTGTDPWKGAIGGPGGPRYPIDDSDEYGVAM